MSRLIMMRGLPASGKTTRAKTVIEEYGNFVRVNRDDLRSMLHFDKWSGRNERITIEVEKAIVRTLLKRGENVIVDDTNLGQKHEDMWKSIASEFEAKFEVADMNTHPNVCIINDSNREKKVGSHVIINMAIQYKLAGLSDIIVCDIDGTVADLEHRRHHVKGEEKDWKSFFDKMSDDKPRKDVIDKVRGSVSFRHYNLIFVTARPEKYRQQTKEWLMNNYNGHYHHLIMRRDGDRRPDTVVKKEMYDKYLKHYNIVKVFDDRPSVIRMWRGLGLDVEDVGDGIEF